MTRDKKGRPKDKNGCRRSVVNTGDVLRGRDENVGIVNQKARLILTK